MNDENNLKFCDNCKEYCNDPDDNKCCMHDITNWVYTNPDYYCCEWKSKDMPRKRKIDFILQDDKYMADGA